MPSPLPIQDDFFFAFFSRVDWKIFVTIGIFYTLFASPQLRGAENKVEKVVALSSRQSDTATAQSNQTDALAVVHPNAVNGTVEDDRKTILADALLKIEALEKELKKTRLAIAAALTTGELDKIDIQRLGIAESFAAVIAEGSEFASKSLSACRTVCVEIDASRLDDTEKARIKCRIDELSLAAERFACLTRSSRGGQKLQASRILDVNVKLGVVVLSTGSADGVRCGLLWSVKNADGVQLKVVSVRQNVSAAAVVNGDLRSLEPGMLAEVGRVDKD